ncbi:hypothetical protein [Terrarubrum flagellatum]|uniref:hypothetical protein n=1 Tax=Terrirubrum flagellatum TaxID=2895980 RepID=UPI003144E1C2
MLSTLLPQRIGSRIEIPNDESGLLYAVEAFGFFTEHVDEEKIVLRRQAPNEALGGAAATTRAQPVDGDLANRIRVLSAR